MPFYYIFCTATFILLLSFATLQPLEAQNNDTLPAAAQDLGALRITGDYRGVRMTELLTILQGRFQMQFYFDPSLLPDYEIFVQFSQKPFFEAMAIILEGTGLVCAPARTGLALIVPKSELNRVYANQLIEAWESGKMKFPDQQVVLEQTLTFGSANKKSKANSLVFKGLLLDAFTKEPIIGATLFDAATQRGTDTDTDGRFELLLPPGEHQLRIQYVGYQRIDLQLFLYENADTRLILEPMAFRLNEVVIRAKADDSKIRSTQIGVENLTIQSIKELPTALGEADVVRSLETLPGVSTVGEGAAGFNVRGGSIDQNLILQDGAPIFNSAHALGFFSAFNPDVISDVTLFKGSVPAQYGGRLSSVLNVRIKDGDFQNYHATGGIGLAYSRLAVEGPIVRNRTSFIVGSRFSYADWMLGLVRDENISRSSVKFYDLTAKISHRIGERHFLSLSGFQSTDFLRYAKEFGYEWQTQTLTLGWNFLLSEKLSASFKAVSGDYSSALFEPSGSGASNLSNGLQYYLLRENIFYQPSAASQFNAGIEWTRYAAKPETLEPYHNESSIIPQTIHKDIGDETALYANAEISLSARFALSLGIRYAYYRQLGPREVYTYDETVPRQPNTRTDTLRYNTGEVAESYAGWEPRIALKYELGTNSSVKLGYNRLRQYIHLISNSAAATPVDVWQVSTVHIPPQAAHNFSLGYFHNLKQNLWQVAVEAYYKQMENLLTYKELPQLLLNEQIETELLSAEGQAYGLEFSIRKTSGKWSGLLAYTFSRSWLRTPDAFSSETVNNGNWFPANFDQPHQVNLILKRQTNPLQSFTIAFAYKSGRPFTIPTSNYAVSGIVISHYSPRNEGRIPAYHRLDFSYNMDKTAAQEKGFRSSFTFSVYNLYARRNPFSVYYQRNERNQQAVYRLAILGTALPALSWNFVF